MMGSPGFIRASTVSLWSGIGNVYNMQGQYERALEYYQMALEIDIIKVSGQKNPDVAASES